MMTVHLELSDPSVSKIVKTAFPEFSGKRVQCEISDTVRFWGTQWDGGYRRTYRLLRLADMQLIQIPEQPFLRESDLHRDSHKLEPGMVVVVHVQGRVPHIEIISAAENVSGLLPAPIELSEDEKIVLEATCCYKSSYSGISNYRYHEAKRKTNITLERWNSAKESLTVSGYLDKRGAVTVKGRNARP